MTTNPLKLQRLPRALHEVIQGRESPFYVDGMRQQEVPLCKCVGSAVRTRKTLHSVARRQVAPQEEPQNDGRSGEKKRLQRQKQNLRLAEAAPLHFDQRYRVDVSREAAAESPPMAPNWLRGDCRFRQADRAADLASLQSLSPGRLQTISSRHPLDSRTTFRKTSGAGGLRSTLRGALEHSTMSGESVPSSPRHAQAKRRSNLSTNGSVGPLQTPPQTPVSNSYSLSRRSSQSSIRTIATTFSVNSSATSTSISSAKFERAYVNQSQKWNNCSPGVVRHPSISSQYSLASVRSVPAHVLGKKNTLRTQLKAVEALLKESPGLTMTETGSLGWLLAHERHLLQVAIKYDERAHSEWEAAQDWQISAQEGPVSKIFVTQPSRFGLTPEQHKYRVGQARTLGNNALDLWRFSDLNYQDAYRIRGTREKLQAEAALETQAGKSKSQASKAASSENPDKQKDKSGRRDFQSWLKEVSKNGDEAMKAVCVKDDGTIQRSPKATTNNIGCAAAATEDVPC